MNNRYYSLDVFRGATVALMILVNNPGSWTHIYAPLEHADWHGCTPTDLVFPFFLFAVGNAAAFVIPRLKQSGTSFFLQKIFRRALLIFAIGLFLNWSPFVKWSDGVLVLKSWSTIRIMGVLQRIAICYLFASLIAYFFKPRAIAFIGALLLIIYWLSTKYFGSPLNPYSLEGFWGTRIDLMLLGPDHMYKGEGVPFDPEGIVSTLPAITQVLTGYIAGWYILKTGKSLRLLLPLTLSGFLLIIGGLTWAYVFPLNKKIWSSSYVLFTSGIAVLILTLLIYLIEFKSIKGYICRFFDVFGKNALFIFVLSGFLPRILGLIRIKSQGSDAYTTPFAWFYSHICAPISDNPKNGSFFYAVMLLLFYWTIALILDKKKIYIKV